MACLFLYPIDQLWMRWTEIEVPYEVHHFYAHFDWLQSNVFQLLENLITNCNCKSIETMEVNKIFSKCHHSTKISHFLPLHAGDAIVAFLWSKCLLYVFFIVPDYGRIQFRPATKWRNPRIANDVTIMTFDSKNKTITHRPCDSLGHRYHVTDVSY